MISIYLIKYVDLQAAKEKVLASCGEGKGERYSISYLPSGAPQLLAGGKVKGYMSISHTDDLLVMAFGDKAVGVDVERADRTISPKICSSIEQWTRIEAYVKWTGKGLSKDAVYGQIPDGIISTLNWEEYVISVCSNSQGVEIVQLS